MNGDQRGLNLYAETNSNRVSLDWGLGGDLAPDLNHSNLVNLRLTQVLLFLLLICPTTSPFLPKLLKNLEEICEKPCGPRSNQNLPAIDDRRRFCDVENCVATCPKLFVFRRIESSPHLWQRV